MFTRSTATRGDSPGRSVTRSIAAFCTAALASAALVVLPSLSANADEATDALAIVAAEARAAADEADVIADAAETAAADAAAHAAQARADSDAAAALVVTATEELAASPDDIALIDALAATVAAAATADGVADEAEQASADAAALATEARATANGLEDAAVAAEAELEAALNPPGDEVIEGEGDQLQETQKFILNPCDTQSLESFTAENKSSWEWCTPEPDIEIHVKKVCPTEVYVEIGNLIPWGDYEVWVDGVKHDAVQDHGKIQFTVTDFVDGKFEVKVKYGKDKWTKDHEYIKADCPSGKAEIERACKVIDGDAEVEISVWDLSKWREYAITVTGPGGYVKEFDVSWAQSWHKDLDLYPGEYTVTIESDDKKPHIGPVSFTFTVDPCPGEVVITMTPVCAPTSTGSLGAVLSGLVVGREYHVTLTGSGGNVITDTTFTAASSSWAVPPANIPPGTYTVTVVDTHSHAPYVHTMDEKNRPPKAPKDPLTWTATGTVSSCPPVILPTLAHTGSQVGGAAYVGLLLLPVGAGLLLARRRQNRREAGLERSE